MARRLGWSNALKLTWFGGAVTRIHIGGTIVVVNAIEAPAGIDQAELVSGADRLVQIGGESLASADATSWRPRRARPLDDEDGPAETLVWTVGAGTILIEAVGELPLLLVTAELPALGRWVSDAVVLLFGDGAALSALAQTLLAVAAPKLIALAGPEAAVDMAIDAVRAGLDGTGLIALEAGLAVEV